jgi:hypothetical protein
MIGRSGYGESVFLAERKDAERQRLRVSLAQARSDLKQATNLEKLMKKHPVALTASALGLGFLAALIAIRSVRKQDRMPASTPVSVAGHSQTTHASASDLAKQVALPFIADLAIGIFQRWRASQDEHGVRA